jgi:hypothetical protein
MGRTLKYGENKVCKLRSRTSSSMTYCDITHEKGWSKDTICNSWSLTPHILSDRYIQHNHRLLRKSVQGAEPVAVDGIWRLNLKLRWLPWTKTSPLTSKPMTSERNTNLEIRKACHCVRSEVFMAVTMKNTVFWDATSCGSCRNRRFGGMYCFHIKVTKICESSITSNRNMLRRNTIDGISNECLRHIPRRPLGHVTLFNQCLVLGHFRAHWEKPNNHNYRAPEDTKTTLRPISPFPATGTVSETPIFRTIHKSTKERNTKCKSVWLSSRLQYDISVYENGGSRS